MTKPKEYRTVAVDLVDHQLIDRLAKLTGMSRKRIVHDAILLFAKRSLSGSVSGNGARAGENGGGDDVPVTSKLTRAI